MSGEESGKNIDELLGYDSSKEDTLWSMIGEFYNRKMLGSIIVVWVYAIIFVAMAVFSAMSFFKSEGTKEQLMYAAIFICSIQFICLMKVFAWQMIHRNSIKRQIKCLEIRIAELAEMVKSK